MADAEQLLEQMFSWLEQRESCAQKLREAASRIEVGVTTSADAASTQSLLPSDIMNDTHDTDRKRKEISEIIQQLFQILFEQLKAEIMGGSVGSVFARPELIEHWKDLIEKNNVTEASQSLRDTADGMTRMTRRLRGQFDHAKRMSEEMANSQHTLQSRGDQQDEDGAESTEDNVSLRVALLNVRSMGKKTTQVKELISQNNLDIFCSTESWLNADSADKILREASPLTFESCHSVRPGRGGGVVIQFSKKSHGKQISFTCTTGTFEFVLIISLYRPPKPNMTQFLNNFEKLLKEISEKYECIVITGDFNVWVDDQSKGKRLKCLLQKYELVQHVKVPTHHKGHTVDLVITRKVRIHRCFVRDDGISDHHTVYFNMRPVSVDTDSDQEELINILGEGIGELKMNE